MNAQWTAAPANPPASNATAPINVSGTYQAKLGDLGAVRMRAGEYCDAAGLNCKTVSSMGGGVAEVVAMGTFNGDQLYNSANVASIVQSGTAWTVTLSSAPTGDNYYAVIANVGSNDQADVSVVSPTQFSVQARTSNFNPFLAARFSFVVYVSNVDQASITSWNIGAFGSCIVPGGGYGNGTQTRTVVCKDGNGSTVTDSSCPAPKPATTQACVTYAPQVNNSCFIAGTKVVMADGSIKDIETVIIGEKVKGSDGSINTVMGYDRPMLGSRLLYSFNDGAYFVTSEHPFFTTDGWKAIDVDAFISENASLVDELKVTTLQVGDSIVMDDGSITKINSIKSKVAPDQRLYNLNLDGNNTYFADGYATHNKKD